VRGLRPTSTRAAVYPGEPTSAATAAGAADAAGAAGAAGAELFFFRPQAGFALFNIYANTILFL
jgi:hypothetical protein